jgi:formylmethanofuran dehydrogenase subunit C
MPQSRAYQDMNRIPNEALAKVKELRNLSDRLRSREDSRIPTDVASLERQQSELFRRLEDDLTNLGEIGEKMKRGNIDVDPTTNTCAGETHERPAVDSSEVPRQGLQRFLRISRSFIKYNLTRSF